MLYQLKNLCSIFKIRNSGGSAIVPAVIPRAYVGYFLLMASQPVWRAEARRNNQRHENNCYRREVGKRSLKNYLFIFVGNPK